MTPALRYLSVCSGIEAASVAWLPLGWEGAAFAEIDAFPAAVPAHHYRGKPAADGPRYKTLGNSIAVPVMRWIGERIEEFGNIYHFSY